MTYDRVTSLPPDSPVAYVDMAGNSELRATLHRHFGDQMKYSGRIGLTHRGYVAGRAGTAGRQAEPGSSRPTRSASAPRSGDPAASIRRFGAAWSGFAPMLDRWLTVTEGRGPAAVKQVYLDTLNGRVPPEQGHILSLGGIAGISFTPFLGDAKSV